MPIEAGPGSIAQTHPHYIVHMEMEEDDQWNYTPHIHTRSDPHSHLKKI